MKKTLAILLALAMVFSTFTVAFAEGTIGAEAQACVTLGMLKGDTSAGVTADYVATAPKRIQAALLFLRLKGLEQTALAFNGADNFADADQAAWAKPVMAYLKANPQLGFNGIGNDKFDPNGLMNASSYYKVVLTALGYKQTTTDVVGDYVWADVLKFAESKGLKNVAAVTNFTVNDLAKATIEGMKATIKDSTKTLAASLVDSKAITEKQAVDAGVYTNVVPMVVKTVKAVANTKVNVTVENALTTAPQASAFVIKDAAGVALEVKGVALSADGKTIILTTAAQTAYAAYNVTVAGVTKAIVGIPVDTTSPTLSTVLPADGNKVTVTFSEPVDPVTGSTVTNYTVAGLAIIKAEVSGAVVTLSTANQAVGTIYTLVVQNVADVAGNVMDKDDELFGGTPLDTDIVALTLAVADSNTTVKLTFDDELNKAAAENITNYAIDGLSIIKAELNVDKTDTANYLKTVILTTSAQTVTNIYKIVIKDTLTDKAGNKFDVDTDEVLFGGQAPDTTKPEVYTVTSVGGNKVEVDFTEDHKLDKTSAENVANYSIAGLAITKAELNTAGKKVTLTTPTQEVSKLYTLKTTGVKDNSGNVMEGTDEAMFGGTPLDVDGPTISSVSASNKKVTIQFNEEVDKETAETLTNYVFDGSLGYATSAVKDTTLDSDGKTVVLTTANQTAGKIYNVTVYNVKDVNGNAIKTADDASKMTFVGITTASTVGPKLVSVIPVNKNTVDLLFDQEIQAAATGKVTITLAALNNDGTAYAYNGTGLTNSNIEAFRQADKKIVRVNFGILGAATGNAEVFKSGTVYKINVSAVNNVDGLAIQTTNDSDHIKAFAGLSADDVKPFVTATVPVDATTVDVYFSEPVTDVEATDFTIVRADGNTGTLVNKVFTGTSEVTIADRVEKVRLYLAGTALESGKVYSLKLNSSDVYDAAMFDTAKVSTDSTTYNVSFAGVSTANAAPKVSTAIVVNTNTVKVIFSEPVAYTFVPTDWSITWKSGTADTLATKNLTGAIGKFNDAQTELTIYLDGTIANNALIGGAVYEIAATNALGITDISGLAFDTDAADQKSAFGGTNATNAEMTIVAATGDVSAKTITITLSEAVNTAVAQLAIANDATKYAVYLHGKTDIAATINTASYDASNNTVTLTIAEALLTSTIYDVKVTGALKDYNMKTIKANNTVGFTMLP